LKLTYDIFKELPSGGGPLWVEAVDSIESAEARVATLNETQPGAYFVYDFSRNQRIPLRSETNAA
jgi:hypothetical protein